MEGTTWTSGRLDDLAESMRSGFARVDQNFARVDQDIRDLRAEMHQEFRSMRLVLYSVGGGIIVTLIGVIGAILARGG